jgi:hypothetical protein
MRALYICAFVLVTAAAGAGCSGESTPFPNFVGTWQYAAGSKIDSTGTNPICTQSTPLVGNLRVAPAFANADIVTLDAIGCDITYKISGPTATGIGGLTCTHPTAQGMGVTETDTYSMITLTTNDGKTLAENAAGMAQFMSPAGNLTCTFTVTANFTKVSND